MEAVNIEATKDKALQAINAIVQGTIDDLTDVWLRMYSAEVTSQYLCTLAPHFQTFVNEICDEAVNRQEQFHKKIAELNDEHKHLQQQLKCPPLTAASAIADIPLYEQQIMLDEQLQELRDQLANRQELVVGLCERERELCAALCQRPDGLAVDPLPSAAEIDAFEFRLNELQCERDARHQHVRELCASINAVAGAMEMPIPRDTAGQLVRAITAANTDSASQSVPVSANDVARLVELQHSLIDRQSTIRREIGELLAQLRRMYTMLEMSPRSQAVRMPAGKLVTSGSGASNNDLSCVLLSDADAAVVGMPFTKKTADCLRAEIERCMRIRRQNIQRLVERVRSQIEQLWELAMRSDLERARFTHFTNDCYTEDLLYMHELELDDLQQFCDDNAELLASIREHQQLFECLLALEAKEKEPGRYQNRGGQLLAEEKERRAINKKLPKIMADIDRLEGAYNAVNASRPFTVWGQPAKVYIEQMHAAREEQRVKQSSARKQTPRAAASGGGGASMMGTSSVQRSMAMGAGRTPMSVSRLPAARVGGGGGASALKRTASTTSINPLSTTKKARIHTVSTAGITPNKPVKRNILSELAQGTLRNGTVIGSATKATPIATSMRRPTAPPAATPSKLTPHRFARPLATVGAGRPARPAAVVDTLAAGGKKRRSRRKSHNKSNSKANDVPRFVVTDCSSSQADDSYVVFEERVNSKSRSSVLPADLPTTSRGAGHMPGGKMRRKSRPSLATKASASRRSPTPSSANLLSPAHMLF